MAFIKSYLPEKIFNAIKNIPLLKKYLNYSQDETDEMYNFIPTRNRLKVKNILDPHFNFISPITNITIDYIAEHDISGRCIDKIEEPVAKFKYLDIIDIISYRNKHFYLITPTHIVACDIKKKN